MIALTYTCDSCGIVSDDQQQVSEDWLVVAFGTPNVEAVESFDLCPACWPLVHDIVTATTAGRLP